MKKTLFGLLAVVGCATSQNHLGGNIYTEIHRGRIGDYFVEARQTYIGDFCSSRLIILTEREGMHIKQNHVSYVEARDEGCNDGIDNLRFRGVQTRQINEEDLKEELIFYFHAVWPIR